MRNAMKKIIQILNILFFSGIAFIASAKDVDVLEYSTLKQKAIDFENSLPLEINSQLNHSYGPILAEVFKQCVPVARPTSFEVISYVNKDGIAEKNWTMTPSQFGQCAKQVFYGQKLYSIDEKPFYAILNFNLRQESDN